MTERMNLIIEFFEKNRDRFREKYFEGKDFGFGEHGDWIQCYRGSDIKGLAALRVKDVIHRGKNLKTIEFFVVLLADGYEKEELNLQQLKNVVSNFIKGTLPEFFYLFQHLDLSVFKGPLLKFQDSPWDPAMQQTFDLVELFYFMFPELLSGTTITRFFTSVVFMKKKKS